jgi:hypothetical protein
LTTRALLSGQTYTPEEQRAAVSESLDLLIAPGLRADSSYSGQK